MDAAGWARKNMLRRHKGGQDDYWRVCELSQRAAFSMAWAGALQEHRLDQHGCPRYYHHRSHSTAAAVDFADASIDVLCIIS